MVNLNPKDSIEHTLELCCHRYYMTLCKLQRSIRRFLMRRFVVYALMNAQWTRIEIRFVETKVIVLPEGFEDDYGNTLFYINTIIMDISKVIIYR